MDDILKSGCFESPLGENNVDWFVDEVMKLETKMALYLENTKKDIIMSQEEVEHYRETDICRFCEKNTESVKVRFHCHLIVKYNGSAYNKCKIKVEQKQSKFTPFVIHNLSNYDCHLFF